MTGRGASDDDMPVFTWSARGDVPPVGDPAFDALLAGNLLAQDTAEGLRPVAEAIAALNGAPAASELAAGADALAVFRGAAGRSAEPARSRRRRRPLLTSLISAKLAAIAAAAAVSLGSAAAAAYAGALPAPVQRLAHDTIGAPAARPGPRPAHPATPVGPDPAGHAGYGLCTAYAHLKAQGSAAQKAVAFRNLATAAGGTAKITAYCAGIAHPGATPSSQPASHPTGQPTSHPTGKPASHPGGKPTSHPGGKPASHPTGGKPTSHPTGKPTDTP
jgi:hypothetical protein